VNDQVLAALTALATVGSVIVAVAALIFSISSFNRQQSRADDQQERAEKLAKDSVKPLLWIAGQNYIGMKSVQLRNHGLGPAIIKSARFEKRGDSTSNLVDLFDDIGAASWVTYVDLPPKLVIPAGSSLVLIRQSLENLREQGISETDALKLLNRIQIRKKGVKVVINYLDIFEQEMTAVDFTI
jgi:hypothetical protein